jgi:hypothetical protein
MKLLLLALALLSVACSNVPQTAMRTADAQFQHVHKALARGWYADARVPWEQVKANVRRGVEAEPMRRHHGQEVDLLALLERWEAGPAAAVTPALATGDPGQVHRALLAAHTACTQCHTLVGREPKKFSPMSPAPSAAALTVPATVLMFGGKPL